MNAFERTLFEYASIGTEALAGALHETSHHPDFNEEFYRDKLTLLYLMENGDTGGMMDPWESNSVYNQITQALMVAQESIDSIIENSHESGQMSDEDRLEYRCWLDLSIKLGNVANRIQATVSLEVPSLNTSHISSVCRLIYRGKGQFSRIFLRDKTGRVNTLPSIVPLSKYHSAYIAMFLYCTRNELGEGKTRKYLFYGDSQRTDLDPGNKEMEAYSKILSKDVSDYAKSISGVPAHVFKTQHSLRALFLNNRIMKHSYEREKVHKIGKLTRNDTSTINGYYATWSKLFQTRLMARGDPMYYEHRGIPEVPESILKIQESEYFKKYLLRFGPPVIKGPFVSEPMYLYWEFVYEKIPRLEKGAKGRYLNGKDLQDVVIKEVYEDGDVACTFPSYKRPHEIFTVMQDDLQLIMPSILKELNSYPTRTGKLTNPSEDYKVARDVIAEEIQLEYCKNVLLEPHDIPKRQKHLYTTVRQRRLQYKAYVGVDCSSNGMCLTVYDVDRKHYKIHYWSGKEHEESLETAEIEFIHEFYTGKDSRESDSRLWKILKSVMKSITTKYSARDVYVGVEKALIPKKDKYSASQKNFTEQVIRLLRKYMANVNEIEALNVKRFWTKNLPENAALTMFQKKYNTSSFPKILMYIAWECKGLPNLLGIGIHFDVSKKLTDKVEKKLKKSIASLNRVLHPVSDIVDSYALVNYIMELDKWGPNKLKKESKILKGKYDKSTNYLDIFKVKHIIVPREGRYLYVDKFEDDSNRCILQHILDDGRYAVTFPDSKDDTEIYYMAESDLTIEPGIGNVYYKTIETYSVMVSDRFTGITIREPKDDTHDPDVHQFHFAPRARNTEDEDKARLKREVDIFIQKYPSIDYVRHNHRNNNWVILSRLTHEKYLNNEAECVKIRNGKKGPINTHTFIKSGDRDMHIKISAFFFIPRVKERNLETQIGRLKQENMEYSKP